MHSARTKISSTRESTSGVSGLGDNGSQVERLKREISHWKTLHARGRDSIILGDANLCYLKWDEEDFQYKELALQVQEYILETSSYQMITSWDELSSTRLRQLDCKYVLSCVCKYKLSQWLLIFLTVNIWGCASLFAKVSVFKIEKY